MRAMLHLYVGTKRYSSWSLRPYVALVQSGLPFELREIAGRKAAAYRASRAGGVADVVAISQREGLTEDYLSVYLSGTTVRRRERFSANLAAQDGRLTARVA